MYYSTTTEPLNNYYNSYDYRNEAWSSYTPSNSFQAYNSESIYVQVPVKKALKRSSRMSNDESVKRIKEEDEPEDLKFLNQTCVSPLTNSSGSNSVNDDFYSETLYKAYQTGEMSKSRYKRLIANERERRRMHGLNVAFENLRSVLPDFGSNKQFSKYETLQMAKSYISALREILLDEENASCSKNFGYFEPKNEPNLNHY